MWAPILEKAWAKVKGAYQNADGGMLVNGIRAVIGCPTFYYRATSIGVQKSNGDYLSYSSDQAFAMLKAADDANYVMGAGTDGDGNDQVTNNCGMAKSHAYSIISVFEMTDASKATHKMLMMRNPWGKTSYSATWSKDDTNWTDDLKAQIPIAGIDPSTSHAQGIFFVPMTLLGPQPDSANNCFSDFVISHYRNSSNYKTVWYDKEGANALVENSIYTVKAPAEDGSLYFFAESYYSKMVPQTCTTGSYTFQGQTYQNQVEPVLLLSVYKNGASSYLAY